MNPAACRPCMVVGADPTPPVATIPTVTIEMPTLGAGFFDEVAKLGARRRTDPAIFLLVWCAESGLDPSATNPSGARGLNQMMPQTLAFFGAPAAFETLTGLQQIPWLEKFIAWTETLNRGPFTSAARCYAGNFYPASLARPDVPSTVIVDRDSLDTSEQRAYASNAAALDVNRDGKITLGDLAARLAIVRHDFDGVFDQLARAVGRLEPSSITWPQVNASSARSPRARSNAGGVAFGAVCVLGALALARGRR